MLSQGQEEPMAPVCPECGGNKSIGGDTLSLWACTTCVVGPALKAMREEEEARASLTEGAR